MHVVIFIQLYVYSMIACYAIICFDNFPLDYVRENIGGAQKSAGPVPQKLGEKRVQPVATRGFTLDQYTYRCTSGTTRPTLEWQVGLCAGIVQVCLCAGILLARTRLAVTRLVEIIEEIPDLKGKVFPIKLVGQGSGQAQADGKMTNAKQEKALKKFRLGNHISSISLSGFNSSTWSHEFVLLIYILFRNICSFILFPQLCPCILRQPIDLSQQPFLVV